MLDIKQLRNDIDSIAQQLKTKGFNLAIESFQSLESSRKSLQVKTEELLAERKKASKAIGEYVRQGMTADEAKKKVQEVLDTIAETLGKKRSRT
jgi:seryl-tRNA synthetase